MAITPTQWRELSQRIRKNQGPLSENMRQHIMNGENRFTRDEAIAIVKEHTAGELHGAPAGSAYAAGLRDALEALAAAGVFSDWPCRHETGEMECVGPCACGTMADLLDAAGIR